MRHIQVIRARTREPEPCSVSLELYQSPVILYSQYSDEDDGSAGPTHLGLAVTVSLDGRRRIGGVTLVRQVLIRRKIPQTKQWARWEPLQQEQIQVVGERTVCGKQRFETCLSLPPRLPESRRTHHDQVVHLITAAVHDLAPSYYTSPAQLRVSQAKHKQSPKHAATSLPPVQEDVPMDMEQKKRFELATCKKIFQVVRCPSAPGDVPVLHSEQTLKLSDSGQVNIKTSSDLFVLGSKIDLSLDLQNLTPATTIHAMSVKLIQETCTPVKTSLSDLHTPAPTPTNSTPTRTRVRDRTVFARLSTLWANFKEKPPLPESSILDEYALLDVGEDHIISQGGGFGIRQGSCVWRGETGRSMDTSRGLSDDGVYLDDSKLNHGVVEGPDMESVERATSRLRVHRVARLPSEVNGAHPSSSTLVPFFAKVSHWITVDVIYSVLGQDRQGKPDGTDEGAMRQGRTVIAVGLAPCTVIPSTVQPPSYFSPSRPFSLLRRRMSNDTGCVSTQSVETHPCPPSAKVPHSRAFRASNGRVVAGKRVFYSDAEIRDAVERHHRDKGDCACGLDW